MFCFHKEINKEYGAVKNSGKLSWGFLAITPGTWLSHPHKDDAFEKLQIVLDDVLELHGLCNI